MLLRPCDDSVQHTALTFASSLQDCFFYSLVFDPVQKTLLADQGEIRVGSKYQAEIPDKLAESEPFVYKALVHNNNSAQGPDQKSFTCI